MGTPCRDPGGWSPPRRGDHPPAQPVAPARLSRDDPRGAIRWPRRVGSSLLRHPRPHGCPRCRSGRRVDGAGTRDQPGRMARSRPGFDHVGGAPDVDPALVRRRLASGPATRYHAVVHVRRGVARQLDRLVPALAPRPAQRRGWGRATFRWRCPERASDDPRRRRRWGPSHRSPSHHRNPARSLCRRAPDTARRIDTGPGDTGSPAPRRPAPRRPTPSRQAPERRARRRQGGRRR